MFMHFPFWGFRAFSPPLYLNPSVSITGIWSWIFWYGKYCLHVALQLAHQTETNWQKGITNHVKSWTVGPWNNTVVSIWNMTLHKCDIKSKITMHINKTSHIISRCRSLVWIFWFTNDLEAWVVAECRNCVCASNGQPREVMVRSAWLWWRLIAAQQFLIAKLLSITCIVMILVSPEKSRLWKNL